jgi:hypothetical protein
VDQELGAFLCLTLSFSRSSSPSHSAGRWNESWHGESRGGLHTANLQIACITSFPISQSSVTWTQLGKVVTCSELWAQMLRKTGLSEHVSIALAQEWTLHWRGGSLLPSLLTPEVSFWVC